MTITARIIIVGVVTLCVYGLIVSLRMIYLAKHKRDPKEVFDKRIGIFNLIVAVIVIPVWLRYWIYFLQEKNSWQAKLLCEFETLLWTLMGVILLIGLILGFQSICILCACYLLVSVFAFFAILSSKKLLRS